MTFYAEPRYNINMPYFDEIVKHLMDRFPYPFAVLALNTPDVEVGDSLGTEQPTVKIHHSDMTFKVYLLDFREFSTSA